MKKITIKTEDALKAYNVLATAKYSKLEDADKIKVWKTVRGLKPVAEKFEEDSRDAAERLKPEGDYNERLAKAQEYERLVKQADFAPENLPIGAAEYAAFVEEFKSYNKLVNDAVREFAEKEADVDIDPISEDAFGKLMASNDWTMAQAMTLEVMIEN